MYCVWVIRADGLDIHIWTLRLHKTYYLVLKHLFWPGLKADVIAHCRACHICQMAGKPNQVIPPAPLHPIPAVGELFKCVIIDCAAPLTETFPHLEENQLCELLCLTSEFSCLLGDVPSRTTVVEHDTTGGTARQRASIPSKPQKTGLDKNRV